jgi:hypothetical protein
VLSDANCTVKVAGCGAVVFVVDVTVDRLVVDGGRVVELADGAVVAGADVEGAEVGVAVVGVAVAGAVVAGAVVAGAVVAGAVVAVVAVVITVSDVPRTDGFEGSAVEMDRSPTRPKRATSSRTGAMANAKKARRPLSPVNSSAPLSIGAHATRRHR